MHICGMLVRLNVKFNVILSGDPREGIRDLLIESMDLTILNLRKWLLGRLIVHKLRIYIT